MKAGSPSRTNPRYRESILPMILNLSFTPSSDSILFLLEAAKVYALLINSDKRSPPLASLEPIDTDGSALWLGLYAAIKAVL
jgi:hypothetical protein